MYNVPKWSNSKIFKVRLTILGYYALKGLESPDGFTININHNIILWNFIKYGYSTNILHSEK